MPFGRLAPSVLLAAASTGWKAINRSQGAPQESLGLAMDKYTDETEGVEESKPTGSK